ncbi:B3 domain-containing protein Os04g0386900-like isoform X2 [Rhododendron vialii]|nr:B3 domain-containing protein Os04g0386900-like isoform X2 [Rhododendron vialii]XP_058225115.1 B3 domain-containing protein Os04g0386900-like isoform X2 [Rhododendron vialii]
MENPQASPISNSRKSEIKEDEFWPLSEKPYFSIVLSQSQLNGHLSLPVKIGRALPSSSVPLILSCCGKNWDMVYLGERSQGKLNSGWKTFARDNNLKVGDACVFELMESGSDVIRFRVQILRGDFPPELEERVNGETSYTPIVLD